MHYRVPQATKRQPAARVTVAVTLALAALLTACSSSPDSDESGQQGGDQRGEQQTFRDHTEWQLAYASCMRDEGIDMPDPDPSGGGMRVPMDDMAALEQASTTCRAKLGNAPAPDGREPMSDEAMLEHQLRAAQCFREHGFDVDDPAPGRALGIPNDVSQDVLETCVLGTQQGGSQ